MKTAMQELDWEVIMNPDLDLREWYLTNRHLLLEKEKQQIIDAYNTGKGHEQFGILDEIGASGNDYYNQTLNQP